MIKTNTLIILDGFGYSEQKYGNAIAEEGIPNFLRLWNEFPHTLISASGRRVGLPDGQMGNSEVGHLNIGSGRVVYQDLTRIDKSIEDGEFFENEQLNKAVDFALKHNGRVHLCGLLGDGGVHSSINHLFALLRLCKKRGAKEVFVHCITDGRDTAPDSGKAFIARLEEEIASVGVGEIATLCGRFYYMDRDNRWDRVERAYRTVFEAEGQKFDSAEQAIDRSYAEGVTDEFVVPCVVGNYDGVKDGDAFIFYNFRSDRARQMSKVLTDDSFTMFKRTKKDIYYVGMTEYDTSLNMHVAFGPKRIANTLGEYLSSKGLSQTRIAETEKYAHVTFFFNGGVETPNDGESRILVPSPKVTTYDLQPQMSAEEVTEKALDVIGKTDVLIMNYANCDMVGHTGIMEAAVKAVKTVDDCFIKIVEATVATGGNVIVTADHGNAECMIEDGKPMTAHTTNLVPLVVVGSEMKGKTLRSGGALCDVAPTLLELIGLAVPPEMEGKSLIER